MTNGIETYKVNYLIEEYECLLKRVKLGKIFTLMGCVTCFIGFCMSCSVLFTEHDSREGLIWFVTLIIYPSLAFCLHRLMKTNKKLKKKVVYAIQTLNVYTEGLEK